MRAEKKAQLANKQIIAYEPMKAGAAAAASLNVKPPFKTKNFCSSIEVQKIPSSSTNIFYQAQKPPH